MEQLPIETQSVSETTELPAQQIVELPAPVLERVGGGIAAFTF